MGAVPCSQSTTCL